jgi:two-component system, OmpR family, response regulator VanR
MDFSKQNILIIEDDIETLEIMIELFESEFSNVLRATNGYEAFETFKNNKIDVILCDINIPKLNGLDTINKIRKTDYSIPIIVISAYSDSDNLLKASNSNIQGYITKPLTLDKIEDILHKIFYHQNHQLINNNIQLNSSTILDLENSQVIVNNKVKKLTNKELEFIKLLLQKKNSIVSYITIEQVLWNDDKIMTSTSLRTLVKNIRKKLSCDIIENIPKIGYKLEIQN